MNKKASESKDDWQRFERAVDIALKTAAKHKKVSRKKGKKRAKV